MNSKKLITMVLLLLLLFAIPIQVFAMGAATAEIPFTVKNAPGTVVVEAVDDAPLPEQTVFEGVSAGKFALSFAEPGDYYYKIYQKSGTAQDVAYDSTVYTVCVSVFLDENGDLYSVVAVSTADSAQKAEDIVFENTLAQASDPSEPTVPTEPSSPSEPSIPSEPSSPNEPDATTTPDPSGTPPLTGDESHLGLWIVLMAFSVLGFTAVSIVYIVSSRRPQKRKQK